jgi:inward rectifier potassium channel
MVTRRLLLRRASLFDRDFVTHGLPRHIWQDLYHIFMTVRWPTLFTAFAAFFLLFNLLFAGIYALQPGDVANLDPRGYWGLFFFSVETFATVGYGDMHPQSPFAHMVATLENFAGLTTLALSTGMMFARFSRPSARFLFASRAVVRPFDGVPTLMLRCANARQNIIMEATAQLRLLRDERTVEGYRIRRIYDLPLRRTHHPVFLFGWTLLHPIDASSPFANASAQSLDADRAMLLLTISGTDETTGQTLMTRARYPGSAIHWDASFVDILHTDEHGVDHFDYSKFDNIEPLSPPATAARPQAAPEDSSRL